jgi:hypothetical protein
MSSRFPKAYTAEVKKDESMMVYVPTATMGIGARPSGLPKTVSDGPKNIEHVGKSASGTGSK